MATAIRKDAKGREYIGKGATLPQAVKAAEKAYQDAKKAKEAKR